MRNMSHNIPLFSLALVAFLMFTASMGGTAQGFSIKMFTTLSPNLTLVEKHQKLIQVSKSRALQFQSITNPNSSSPEVLVPNTITSYIRHAFSDFFYTEINIGTPSQVANLAIDTGSAFTWVQSAECIQCIVPPLPSLDIRKLSSSGVLPYNDPLCVPPFLSPHGHGCSYFLKYADLTTTKGATNVRSIQILGGLDDHYYVRLNGISLNGQHLPIDPNLFTRGGGGVVVDTGAPYSLIVDEAFQILRQVVVDYFYNMYQWQPNPKITTDEFDLCYDVHAVFTVPSVMLHFEGGNMEVQKLSLSKDVDEESRLCMAILSLGTSEDLPSIVGAVQQVNYKFLFDVGAGMLHFAEEDC